MKSPIRLSWFLLLSLPGLWQASSVAGEGINHGDGGETFGLIFHPGEELPPPLDFSKGTVAHVVRTALELEEQRCLDNRSLIAQESLTARQGAKLRGIWSYAKADAERNGIVESRPPAGWDMRHFPRAEAEGWLSRVRAADPEKRCELLELAYGFSITRVSLLPPTKPIRGIKDIQFTQITPDILEDRRRAAWAFRYLHFLDSSLVPPACQTLYREAQRRWNFIFSDRKPLGFAIGMCGRPMNAHYVDEEVLKHQRAIPEGWPEEYRKAFSASPTVEKKGQSRP